MMSRLISQWRQFCRDERYPGVRISLGVAGLLLVGGTWLVTGSLGPERVPPEANVGAVEAERVETEPVERTVYITRSGKKYHREGCRFLSKSKIPISLSAAAGSYEPCSVCLPPRGE